MKAGKAAKKVAKPAKKESKKAAKMAKQAATAAKQAATAIKNAQANESESKISGDVGSPAEGGAPVVGAADGNGSSTAAAGRRAVTAPEEMPTMRSCPR